MGTVNYGTSDYITIGYEPLSSYDLEHDVSFMAELKAEVKKYGGSIEDAMQTYISNTEEDVFSQIERILKKYNFVFFHVVLKPGYYEGFYIDIENNYSWCYNDSSDKQAAQREITQIKSFLTECVEAGLCQVHPGWCTSYDGYAASMQAVNEAVKEMRVEVKETPTYYKLQAAGEVS